MTVLQRRVEASVGGLPVPGTALYTWDSVVPMQMTMQVNMGIGDPVTWYFTRDLLDTAFALDTHTTFHGIGDVQLRVERARIHYWLASDDGTRRSIYTALTPVMDMVMESFKIVSAEDEDIFNGDGDLAKFFGSAS